MQWPFRVASIPGAASALFLMLLQDPAMAETPRLTTAAYNPAISLILNGRLTEFERDPNSYALAGFPLAEEANPGEEGFSLGESELTMTANIDNLFFGSLTAALTAEDEVEVEEAYIETLALGYGLTLRGGRFYSAIGYLNPFHAHAWDFVDAPLPYRAFLGEQFGDDGAQLRWVAPTDLFIEVGAEAFRGDAFPAGGSANQGKGVWTVFAHAGGDVGASHAWRAGLSYLEGEARDRETGEATAPDTFTGSSRMAIMDFIWKWAPEGNASQRNFKFQSEYFLGDEDGEFTPAGGSGETYARKPRGWYAQGVYQFMPRWRAGVRYGQLDADTVPAALQTTVLDSQGHKPKRTSMLVDFSNSEHSRLRVQFNRDESRVGLTDNQWYLQYIMSLGAHGAHRF